jgi:hypothetical protein
MNHHTVEFLARERLNELAREARTWDMRPSEPGTERSSIASIVDLVRRLSRRPALNSPSGPAAAGPHIV